MRTVWKFLLSLGDVTGIEIPRSATVRLVGLDPQSNNPTLWIELDPELPRDTRRFEVFGTGHTIEGDGGHPSPIHVGSVIHGQFVWHVYELRD